MHAFDLPGVRPPADRTSVPRVVIVADGTGQQVLDRAKSLAALLHLPIHDPRVTGVEFALAVTDSRLELRRLGSGRQRPLVVDFVGGKVGYSRRVNRFGLLYRAVGLHLGVRTVLDATAGFGRDAFMLALHGCQVTAVERCPIVASLLADGLQRAAAIADLTEVAGQRIELITADARDVLANLSPPVAVDAVYVDPMFPARRKTALVKKEMRWLRALVGDDLDACDLLAAARRVARKRVVVKRMRHAPALAGDFNHQLSDRTTRFDVYDCHSAPAA